MKKYNLGKIEILLIILLSVWMTFIAIKTIEWTPVPMGESDDYMFTTISLQYGHNMGIDESDLEYAKIDFPEFADYLQSNFNLGLQSSVIDSTTGRLPWYFGTYAALCIPVKMLLKTINQPQILTYAITNYILFLLVIIAVFVIDKGSIKEKLITALLLSINPVVFYMVWQSVEVFMFSMVAISMIFWKNKKYILSGLFVSLAGTMNSTIMILGVCMIIDYFIETYDRTSNIKEYICKNIKNTVFFACSFIPCLVPFIYYKLKYNCWNLQVAYGFASQNNQYLGRVLSYLFDWNYGLFPYFPLLLIAFFSLVIISVVHKKYRNIIYLGAFLGVICAYSIMFHINCGMSGIARYSVWAAPIMIISIIIIYSECLQYIKLIGRKIVNILAGISIIYSLVIINIYGVMFASNTSDIQVTPIGRVIIENVPQLYIELESSFIDRVQHIPGGYQYTEPVYYYDKNYIVTKILLQDGEEDEVLDNLKMDETSYQYVQKQMKSKRGQYYISIPRKYDVHISNNKILNINSFINDGYINLDALVFTGCFDQEKNAIVLKNGEIQFGPYIELPKGSYLITIEGDNLKQAEMKITSNNGDSDISELIEVQKQEDDCIIYSFNTIDDLSRFEILNINNGLEDLYINSIRIQNQ